MASTTPTDAPAELLSNRAGILLNVAFFGGVILLVVGGFWFLNKATADNREAVRLERDAEKVVDIATGHAAARGLVPVSRDATAGELDVTALAGEFAKAGVRRTTIGSGGGTDKNVVVLRRSHWTLNIVLPATPTGEATISATY